MQILEIFKAVDPKVFVAVAILLPLLSGILVYLLRNATLRSTIVLITAWVLTLSSLALFAIGASNHAPIELDIKNFAGLSWDTIILYADLALMALFLYIGIMRKSPLILVLALLQLGPMVYLEFFKHNPQPVSPVFYIDWLGIAMVMIVSIIGSIIVVYALPYMKDHEEHHNTKPSKQPAFFFILIVFLGAMNGLVMTNNLLWMYFFWEVTTLCSFLLIGHDGTDEAKKNANTALILNLLGGIGFVTSLLLLSNMNLPLSVKDILAYASSDPAKAALMLPMALLCFAGFTKAAQFPFQRWLLGAMVAPTPVSALLHSSTMVKAGVFVVVRFAPAFQGTHLSTVVAIAGGFTFLMGAVMAVGQSNAKKVLAYSTISNLGLIIACAGLNTELALTAAVMLIIFHAISKGMLFMATGVVEHKIWSREIEDMQGLVAKMPLTTALMVIGIMTMLLPPFGVLIAKWAAIEASVQLPPALVLFVLGSTFTVVFWAKWMGRLLQTEAGQGGFKIEKIHSMYMGPLLILTAGAVMFSACVGWILHYFLIPAVQSAYLAAGSTITDNLSAELLSIPVWPIFVMLAICIVIPILWFRRVKQTFVPVYMCGEQIKDSPSTFMSVADKPQELTVTSYYLEKLVGEETHSTWVYGVSIALIVIMIGVTFLWKI